MWYLIVWIPDLSLFPHFYLMHMYAKFDKKYIYIPCVSRVMSIFFGQPDIVSGRAIVFLK